MTPAMAYLRVSGKGQLLGDGFDRQREAIERYAAATGHLIIQWFEERAVPGKTEWEDREAWVEMVAAGPKVIIIEGLDRLARQFAIQEIFWRQLRKLEIRLLSTREPDIEDDDADPSRKLIRGMLGLIAEYDRSQIEAKLRSARARIRKREGRCEGRKPFGSWEGEAQTLQLMQGWKDQGWTTRMIAQNLNQMGIATASTTRAWKIPKSGRQWHGSTVAKILSATAAPQPSANASPQSVASGPQGAMFAPESHLIFGLPGA